MTERTIPTNRTFIERLRGRGGALDSNQSGWATLISALYLILGRFAAPGLGFLSWILAARFYDRAEVGLASGAVAAMMLCVQVALLGIGSSVIAIYPQYQNQPRRLLNTAFTIVAGAALLAAILFLTLASGIFDELSVVGANPRYAVAFVGMAVLGTLGVLFDNVSIALRRGDQVFVRNVLFGLVTVAAIGLTPFVLQGAGSLSILLAWVLANVVACSVGAYQLWRAISDFRFGPMVDGAAARQLLGVGLPNYLLTLLERTPAQLLPILVVELLSPATNATWYAIWQMAWVIFVVPWSIAQTLFAEAARKPEALQRELSRSIRSALLIGAAAALGTMVVAPLVLSLLGDSYRQTGVLPLRILVLSALPATFIQMYFAIARARHILREATVVALINGAVGVGAAALAGLRFELTGMAIAWLSTQLITGAWCYWRLRRLVG